MGSRYQHIAFGPESTTRQRQTGSFVTYGAGLESPDEGAQPVTEREIRFVLDAFQFHLATVTPTGWPYLQYRSGPRGFVHHLGGARFGFADFRGNQQFVSVGNIDADGRVALFLADFPRRRRLKLFGRAQVIDAEDDPKLLHELSHVDGREIVARCERSIIVDVEAFDWNCSRSLIPQYTRDEVRELTASYIDQITRLQSEVEELRERLDGL